MGCFLPRHSPFATSKAQEACLALPAGPVAILWWRLWLLEWGCSSKMKGDRHGVTGTGLWGWGAGTSSASLGENWAVRALQLKRQRLWMGFTAGLWSKEQFPTNLWGERRVDMGAWWELLRAEPGTVSLILQVSWEGLFFT